MSEAPLPTAPVKKEEEPPQLQVDPMSAWQSSFIKAATGTTAVAAATAPPVVPTAAAAPIAPIVQEMKVEPKVEEIAVATADAGSTDQPVSPTPTTSTANGSLPYLRSIRNTRRYAVASSAEGDLSAARMEA